MTSIKINQLINQFNGIEGLSDSEVTSYSMVCPVFDFILTHCVITPEQLDQFTYEQLEWALDAVSQAPLKHDKPEHYAGTSMYEYFKSKELQNGLLRLPRVKQNMSFI